MAIRELFGMDYKAVELEHDITDDFAEIFRQLADWANDNGVVGVISSLHTESHPDKEDRFISVLVWAN